MAKNTKGKKTVESVAETLCSFSRFLCDLVIGIYLFVILAVLPLYNRGYAQIGTDKENFFIKTMTYVGKCLLPVFVLWLILRFIVVKQKQELPEFRTIPKRIWQALNTTDKFAALYGIAVVMSYVFTRYREEALWGTGILADGDVDPAGSGHCIFYDLTDVAEKRLDRDPDIAGVDHSFFPRIYE